MNVPGILAAREPVEGGFRAHVPDSWLQGRTAYGGLSAALAYEAAKGVADDLPPLRSAQVSFVGPLAGQITATAKLERRGRNAAFVSAEVHGEKGVGLAAMFVFMRPLESHVRFTDGDLAEAQPPTGPADIPEGSGPGFVQHFQGEFVDFAAAKDKPDIQRWFRLRERGGLDPMTELVLMGDGLPPAAMAVMTEPVTISSLTWIFNVLRPPQTRDGWWLLRATSDHAQDGASSQDMSVWNADGQLIARGMQSIALFG